MGRALDVPLTPAVFFTLFALAGGEKHGYAIMRETRDLSGGSFEMGPATLYTTLQRLLDLDLVEEIDDAERADNRRRTYRLTRSGRSLLDQELARVEALVRKAKSLRPRPAGGRS